MFSFIRKLLIGESLTTDQLKHEKFNIFWGLPVLSSDAISSVAYAGEEMLWVLIPVIGLSSYKYMFYAALCIVLLLFMLVFSYRQTIDNYPNGGGSYIVAKDNLGTIPSLTAAAALSIDYVLTVAVSTSAGTAAIVSAVPQLLKYRVIITLIIISLMTIGNLRGIRDSAKIFGIPTYIFIGSIGVMIITGIVKYYVLGYVPKPLYTVPNAISDVTFFLFIRAFASGCTALTGIEAVSDGIPNFKEPSQKNAKTVLGLLACVVLFIFGGLSFLATLYHAAPSHDVTVISQIATQVFGTTPMYYLVQITTALILVMAANTAFADFPLLLSFIARDGYAPKQFRKRGKRLSFSNGIIILSVLAMILVVIFGGKTHLLMPLYAVGVFLSFTISQTGMLYKWIRQKPEGWKHKALINGMGATVTFIVMLTIIITKFQHGAWIVALLIPVIVLIMLKVRKHYNKVAEQLKLNIKERPRDVSSIKADNQQIIILVDTLNRSFLKALNYSKQISQNIAAFHVSTDDESTEKLKKKWEEYNVGIPLFIKKSPYRDLVSPLMEFIRSEERRTTHGESVTVVITQFVITKWWHKVLHNQTAIFIRNALYKERNVVVVTVPYIIKE